MALAQQGFYKAALQLLMALLFLQASVSALGSKGKLCYSRQHRDAIVNVRVAVESNGAITSTRVKQAEKDCILACCSEEVAPGIKCNMVVYKPSNQPGNDNCYLFHCETEQDCPLMSAKPGINTYDISKDMIHPTTKGNGRATVMPFIRPTLAKQLISTYSTSTAMRPTATAPRITPPITTTTTIPPSTTSTTQPTTTTTTTTSTTLPTTTTFPPTLPTTTTTQATTLSTTTTTTTTQPPTDPSIILVTMPVVTMPSTNATKTVATTTTTTTTTPITSTTTKIPSTTSTTTRPNTQPPQPPAKPNRPSKKPLKPPKKPATKPPTTTTTTQKPTITSTTPPPTTTTITTTTTTTSTTTTTTTTTACTATTERTTVVFVGMNDLKNGASGSDSLMPPAEGSAPDKAKGLQMTWKNGLVAVVVVMLVCFTLVLAIVGRKAMESFDRRHYTRLELNDLHYEI